MCDCYKYADISESGLESASVCSSSEGFKKCTRSYTCLKLSLLHIIKTVNTFVSFKRTLKIIYETLLPICHILLSSRNI